MTGAIVTIIILLSFAGGYIVGLGRGFKHGYHAAIKRVHKDADRLIMERIDELIRERLKT